MCTDVGTRVVAAVCLTVCRMNDYARGLDPEDVLKSQAASEIDPSWLKGPPYTVEEHAFDEFDQEACEPVVAQSVMP